MSRRTLLRAALIGTAGTATGGLLAGCRGGPSTAPTTPTPTPTGGTVADTAATPHRVRYGADPAQWVDRYDVGAGVTARRGAVVVVHGGFWRAAYDASLGAPLAADLARRGWTAWNVEYRRVGAGGGWPATGEDLRAALAEVRAGDPTAPLVTLGHSAGGQLAVWAASSAGVTLAGAVSQAGVLDLVGAAEGAVGGTAVPDLLGGTPAERPDVYAAASPLAHVPLAVPVRCLHSHADGSVPYDQSTTYVDAARAHGADATLTTTEGDHMAHVAVGSSAWAAAVRAVTELLG